MQGRNRTTPLPCCTTTAAAAAGTAAFAKQISRKCYTSQFYPTIEKQKSGEKTQITERKSIDNSPNLRLSAKSNKGKK
jgi:hypothetical protein